MLNFYFIFIHFLKEVCVILLFWKLEFCNITQDGLLIWLCYEMFEDTEGLSEICLDFIFSMHIYENIAIPI